MGARTILETEAMRLHSPKKIITSGKVASQGRNDKDNIVRICLWNNCGFDLFAEMIAAVAAKERVADKDK